MEDRRASSTLHFFTLRSGSSSVQLVSRDMEISKRLMNLPLESVIQVEGIIRQKKAKKTGESSSTYTAVSFPSSLAVSLSSTMSVRADLVELGMKAADSVEVDLAQAILLNPAQEILPFYPNRSDLVSPTWFCNAYGTLHSQGGIKLIRRICRRVKSSRRSIGTST